MAKGRFLSKRVSISQKLANLKSDSPRLLWTWILPHLDREGRFHADLSVIKGHAVPRLKNHTEKTIEADLRELAAAGLILLYEVDGDRYLQFNQFDENQPGIRKEREAESQCPPPPAVLRQYSGSTPAVLRSSAADDAKQALILKLKLELKLKEEEQGKDFDAFWEKYPRKVEKTPAFEAYVSALKGASADDLLRALDGYLADIAENKTEKKYIKHAATFLHKNRWRDYLDKPAKVKKTLRVLQRDGSYEEVEVEE